MIRNLLTYFCVVALMCVAILQYRAAWADPCSPPQGWTGEIVADTPEGQIVVTTDNLYYAAYNPQQYIFSFLPDGHRLMVPFDSVIVANYDVPTCTYHVEYDDDIFNDEGN